MTVINGEISNQLGAKLDGTVWLAAAYHRPVDNVLVLADWAATPLEDSTFSTDAIPGPARLRVEAGSVFAEWDIVVPDQGPVEVTSLMQDSVDYPEPVVLAAQAAATRATQEANRAEEAAAIVGSAEQVLAAEAASAASAATSAASASESADSAAASSASATAAREYEGSSRDLLTEVQTARDHAAESATDAETSASASAESAAYSEDRAAYSEQCANTSRSYNDTAWRARSESIEAKNEAVAAQLAAETARDVSQAHAGHAADSCSQAQDAATNAADDVRQELQGIKSDAQSAASASGTSAGESADSAEQARLSAESAAEVVASGVADATTTIKGKIKLAGDLGGSADSPRVPGLAGKASLAHTHQIGDVIGLQDTVDDVSSATYQAAPGSIARRGADGTMSVSTPTGATHTATKAYVDAQVASRATTADVTALAETVTGRPALWLWDGVSEWSPPEGAVVTDTVINLGTGELHSLEEVAGNE